MTQVELDALVRISRFYGCDEQFVIAGGGNTSVKVGERLFVKASGCALAQATPTSFVEMHRPALLAALEVSAEAEPSVREERFKQAVHSAKANTASSLRPSVEAVLHGLLAAKFVVHTHSTIVNMLACCTKGRELFHEIFGDKFLWIDCTDPGITLARALRSALHEYAKRGEKAFPPAIVVQNHGLIVCGDDEQEIMANTQLVVEPIRKRLGQTPEASQEACRPAATNPGELVNVVAPALRALGTEGGALRMVAFDDSPAVMELARRHDGAETVGCGPLTPDQIVYCNSYPMWVDLGDARAPEAVVAILRDSLADYRARHSGDPGIVIVAGLGLLALGACANDARTSAMVYADVARVISGARRLGGVHHMPTDKRRFIETWEAEAYRRNLSRSKANGRVKGKVALVTGAAQGFGREIAQDLAAQGAHVVLADVNVQGAQETAQAIIAANGANRAMAVAIDVTNSSSIISAVDQVVRAYGGLDVLVSNAGILRAASVYSQSERDFDLVTAVNYKGYFLCVQKVAPILAVQHMARGDYRSDIIQINSKSGLAGSNKNFAYAGGKFGGIGLTQSFALELISDGVKVNSICPGNFFDGPLWSDPKNGLFVQYLRTGKVAGAKTIEDVRRAYEAKVPMGRGCTTPDVMKAIYYLIDQQYETGQALPVTGGQVMLN
ncbi:MAG: SDR family NAD(P)-dependent oxidoreductase [Planctomycetes bacterium]|nr:SDR family NAD(P)-dependent oxidoreductase [Planctomycetota bacterium]